MPQIKGSKLTKAQQLFVNTLVKLHSDAGRLGLFNTSHTLHDAVKVVGWELADMRKK